ncbi:phage tail tape measure protein [Tsukamurella pulmonis]|uniref:phage tail tape measure protein n=1 Tax=Tsukamurella pulmonis TaxID=47312 RepID=UPI0015868FFA|nr:phage tail tape measure protein [Tsukamurella pulmonis]
MATLDVGTLRATLELAHGQFDGDLGRAQAAFRGLGDTAERQGRRAAGSFSGVGRGVQQETDRAERSVRQLGNSGEQAGRRLGQGIQQGSESGMRGIARQAGAAGAEAGDSAGGAAATGMGARIASAARAGGPIGLAIAGIAVVGVGVGKALADNIIAGMEQQAAAGLAKARFGWTPEQAATVGKAAGDAYVRNFGASIDENRDAIGVAIQRRLISGDATSEEMSKIAGQMATLGKATDSDSNEIAIGASAMVTTNLATDSNQAFDLLARAQQKGLNMRGELMETMEEYGTTYRTIGLDGATALGSIEQLMNAGARNVDQAADAVKEFGVNVTSVSEETTGAFERIGLNADDTYAAFARGGDSAREMSQTVIERLQSIEDPMVRNEVGLALFKTKWEDVAGAIRGLDFTTAASQFGSFTGAAQQMADDMGGTASDIEAAKRTVERSMGEVQVKLAETFGPQLAKAAQWVSEHTEEISRAFEIVGGTIGMVAGAVGMIGGTIVGVVGEIIEHTAKLVRGALGPIFTGMEKLGGLMASLPGAAGDVGQSLQATAATGRSWIEGLLHDRVTVSVSCR